MEATPPNTLRSAGRLRRQPGLWGELTAGSSPGTQVHGVWFAAFGRSLKPKADMSQDHEFPSGLLLLLFIIYGVLEECLKLYGKEQR